MRNFRQSILATAITLSLAACGGGESSSNPPPPEEPVLTYLTGAVAHEGHEQKLVKLKVGETELETTTELVSTNGTKAQYFNFTLNEEEIPEGTPITIEAYNIEDVQAASGLGNLRSASNNIDARTLLFSKTFADKSAIFEADTNGDNQINIDELDSLILSTTHTAINVLETRSGKEFQEAVKELGQDNFEAIIGLLNAISHPIDENDPAAFNLPKYNLNLNEFTDDIMTKIEESESNVSALEKVTKAYEDLANEHSLVLQTGWETRLSTAITEAKKTDYTSLTQQAIDSARPTHTLQFQGQIIEGITDPQVELFIGSIPNNPLKTLIKDDDSYQHSKEKPFRFSRLNVTQNGNTTPEIKVNGTHFDFSVTLNDTHNTFEPGQCAPDSVTGYSNAKLDNMQDLLWLSVKDKATGLEMRSLLGAFCELAQVSIDVNQDKTVDSSELPRLNVSFENAAHSLLAERSTLNPYSGAVQTKPVNQSAIETLFTSHSEEHVQFMVTLMAMQLAGNSGGNIIAPDNADSFFNTAASLLGLNYNHKYRLYAKNNIVPPIAALSDNLNNLSDIADGLKVTGQNITELLTATSETINTLSQFDEKIASTIKEGIDGIDGKDTWIPEQLNNGLEFICQESFAVDQIRGISIRGQGDGWLTIGWSEEQASGPYTLHWDTTTFDTPTDAKNTEDPSQQPLHTITGLKEFETYYFQIAHSGTPSAVFKIKKGDFGLINWSTSEEASCDTMTGYGTHSSRNGSGPLNFIKIDDNGQVLERQDLRYQTLPMSCTTETKQGRTWAIPNAVERDGDRIRHWNSLDNRYVHGENVDLNDEDYNGFCTNIDGEVFDTDRAKQCSVQSLIKRANEQKHCGIDSWRLPSYSETINLLEIEHLGINSKIPEGFDNKYFPHLFDVELWTKHVDPHYQPDKQNTGASARTLYLNSSTVFTKNQAIHTPTQVMLVSDGINLSNENNQ